MEIVIKKRDSDLPWMLEELPNELLLEIFSYLNAKEKYLLSLANKQFFWLAFDPQIWKKFSIHLDEKDPKFEKKMNTLFKRFSFSRDITLRDFVGFRNSKIIFSSILSHIKNSLRNLKTIRITHQSTRKQNLSSYQNFFSEEVPIKKLHLKGCFFEPNQSEELFTFGLQKIKVSDRISTPWFFFPSDLKRNSFEPLEKLIKLKISNSSVNYIPDSFCSNAVNLKSLCLKHTKSYYNSANQVLTLPPNFHYLSNLQKLRLENFECSPQPNLFRYISKMPNLEMIQLTDNSIPRLPRSSEHYFGLDHSLRHLVLKRQAIEVFDLDFFSHIPKLEYLSLCRNSIYEIFTSVEKQVFPSLLHLKLSFNLLDSKQFPKLPQHFPNLRTLKIFANPISNISCINQFPNLTHFEFGLNNISSSFERHIFDCKQISILKSDFCHFRLIPQGIKHLSNLEQIYVRGHKLNLMPAHIGSLRNLRIVDLSFNLIPNISDEICQLPNLESLILDHNKIQQVNPKITQLRYLQILSLSYNFIKELPKNFFEFSHLKKLYLIGNEINYDPQFSKLTSLEFCDLTPDNKIYNPIYYNPRSYWHNSYGIVEFLNELRNKDTPQDLFSHFRSSRLFKIKRNKGYEK
ncbi:hypothetical protein M0811_14433 [Anaeramoeba ignava]|uniref:F-box domain-containing protein n=1 Tax=Anaeramoeba ignava TaxID=1746090 RepID=A0A9Q0LVZ7_ANAIG|nr:hypothetical protein M0811_14433 [Anaeramoeba ignava]